MRDLMWMSVAAMTGTPRDVEVHLLHQVDVVEVLLRDERDRDVVDVDSCFLIRCRQQVERALEVLQADRDTPREWIRIPVFHHAYLKFDGVGGTDPWSYGGDALGFFDPSWRMSLHRGRLASTAARRGADRIERGVERAGQLGLDLHVAHTCRPVALLQIVHSGGVGVERVVIDDHGIALDGAGIVGADALGIRVHLPLPASSRPCRHRPMR
jgi:hypothetical protein